MRGGYSKTFPRNTPSFYVCSPPSWGRFWYRVPSKEQGKGPPERTKRSGAVSRTEAAALRQEAVHSLWSRLFCGPLKMHRVPEKAVLRTEYRFRTVEACFLQRMPLKMRRVPQEAFLSTARIFRTVEACFWYRVRPSRSSLILLKSAFIVTICFQMINFPYVASTPLHITCG